MPSVARLATALAAVLGVLAAPASAGVTCRLVTDPAGDQAMYHSATTPAVSTDLDIVSADVSANTRHVVVAIRLATLKPYDPMAPTIRRYRATVVANGVPYDFIADVGQLGGATVVSPYEYAIPATVAMDLPAREIRIATSASNIVGRVSSSTMFRDFAVSTGTYWGLRPGTTRVANTVISGSGLGHGVYVDAAETTRTYRATTPTCVPMPG